ASLAIYEFHRTLLLIQAEDGIRDFHVTGVQTCALPISGRARRVVQAREHGARAVGRAVDVERRVVRHAEVHAVRIGRTYAREARSEERRVGEECTSAAEQASYRLASQAYGSF